MQTNVRHLLRYDHIHRSANFYSEIQPGAANFTLHFAHAPHGSGGE